MPIYEYACPRCEKEFEELVVRRSDEVDVACPSCGAREVVRRMSRPAETRGSGRGGPVARRACGPVG
jgi:putative FmdB family regulatory protein